MNPILKRILETRQVETKDGEPKPLDSEISMNEGLFLQEMITNLQPSNSIEIGCAYGISSLFICEALRPNRGRHTIIDPYQSSYWDSIGILNIERSGFAHMVRFIPERSDHSLPTLNANGETFQFAFIDGDHKFDDVFVDFYYIDKMLDVGGVIVLDDIGYSSIRKVCRYILTNLPYKVIGPKPGNPSWKRRLTQKVTRAVPARLVKPELRLLDEQLGLSSERFIAIRKTVKDDTRHWTFHKEF